MTTATRGDVEVAAAWRLLALGFSPPADEALAEIEALAEALFEMRASAELEALVDAVRATSPGELATEYAAVFRKTVVVAPYEGSYELDPIRQGRQMADVAGFYRAFGAEAHGPGSERPDFVGCELEFLSLLELRRLAAEEADEDGREVLDGIRAAFLTDHAGRWLPTFFAEVRAAADDTSVYRALAVLGDAVLSGELERHGLEPSVLPRRGPSSSLDADALECDASGADLRM
jgi:TorA maturation chaperone TorD